MSRKVSDAQTATDWYFFDGGPAAPRYGDDPTKHAVNHDTESFVREVLQNANDQRKDGEEPVEVTFRFETLSGSDREEFLDAIKWKNGLSGRIASLAEEGRGSGYDRFLERTERSDAELRLLVVEDRNTTGLTGEWGEDSNYAALVRDELYSTKREDTAGGSYGLGKSVLWTFSGASTVVFNSRPVAENGADGEERRLIGRTKLPTHERKGSTFQGAGWLCRTRETQDGIRPESVQGSDARRLASKLHIQRPRATGTSAMVVGYQDPTRDSRLEIEQLAKEFVESSVKYFWPAMIRGDLDVSVETPDQEIEADVDDVPAIQPFVKCYRNGDTDEETITVPGDVAGLDIPVEIPSREDGTDTPDGDVRLAARFASPVNQDTYLNKVALFRGSGMVVKYFDQSRIAYSDRTFFGTLACGKARDTAPSEADEEIDRFLRFAEPPEHDEWESTENLRNEYEQGFRTALDEMFDSVRDGLRHIVAGSSGDESALSNRVLKRFPIHGEVKTRSFSPPTDPVFDIESSSTFENNRWTFEGEVEPRREFQNWTAEVSLSGVGEDGSTGSNIDIDEFSTDPEDAHGGIDGEIASLKVDGSDGCVRFEGSSKPVSSEEVPRRNVGETRIQIQAELETKEDN